MVDATVTVTFEEKYPHPITLKQLSEFALETIQKYNVPADLAEILYINIAPEPVGILGIQPHRMTISYRIPVSAIQPNALRNGVATNGG